MKEEWSIACFGDDMISFQQGHPMAQFDIFHVDFLGNLERGSFFSANIFKDFLIFYKTFS